MTDALGELVPLDENELFGMLGKATGPKDIGLNDVRAYARSGSASGRGAGPNSVVSAVFNRRTQVARAGVAWSEGRYVTTLPLEWPARLLNAPVHQTALMHHSCLMYFPVVALSSQTAPAFVRLAAHPLRWRLLTELAASDYRVRELVTLVGKPQNLVSYHLRLLHGSGLVTAARSSFDGRDSYYHLDLDRCADALADTGTALHPGLGREGSAPRVPPAGLRRAPRVSVLFLCTGNSARSPIAEALLRHRTDGQVEVTSAGSRPKPHLHPSAVRVLDEEFGVDITGQRPRHLDTVAGRRFDYVISLCDKAREACPDFPDQPRRVHWSIPDPAAAGDSDQAGHLAFQHTAADIDTRIRHLLPVLGATRS